MRGRPPGEIALRAKVWSVRADQRRLYAVFAPAVTANSTELPGELAANQIARGESCGDALAVL